jgi:hypothetical protein
MASVILFVPAAPAMAPLAAIATGVKSISLLEIVSIESSFFMLRVPVQILSYPFTTGGQILTALFGPFGACTNSGTTECPFNPKGECATAGA